MPFCQNCGVKVSDEANFCFSCGKSIVKILATKKDLIQKYQKASPNNVISNERKKKWTDEALIEEYEKNGTIEKFKESKYYVWLIFKKRGLVEKLGIVEESLKLAKDPTKVGSENTKQISVAEYASKIDPKDFRENRKNPSAKITQQAIKYRIMNNMHLPEVLNYMKVGKVHVLTVKADF